VGNLYIEIEPTQYMFFYDLDCDGDGLRDSPEGNSYYTDPGNPDSDGDGISDGDEVFIYNTNPSVPDSAIPATLIIQKCPL